MSPTTHHITSRFHAAHNHAQERFASESDLRIEFRQAMHHDILLLTCSDPRGARAHHLGIPSGCSKTYPIAGGVPSLNRVSFRRALEARLTRVTERQSKHGLLVLTALHYADTPELGCAAYKGDLTRATHEAAWFARQCKPRYYADGLRNATLRYNTTTGKLDLLHPQEERWHAFDELDSACDFIRFPPPELAHDVLLSDLCYLSLRHREARKQHPPLEQHNAIGIVCAEGKGMGSFAHSPDFFPVRLDHDRCLTNSLPIFVQKVRENLLRLHHWSTPICIYVVCPTSRGAEGARAMSQIIADIASSAADRALIQTFPYLMDNASRTLRAVN